MPYKKLLCLLQLVLSQVPPFALRSQAVLPPLQARLPPTPRKNLRITSVGLAMHQATAA